MYFYLKIKPTASASAGWKTCSLENRHLKKKNSIIFFIQMSGHETCLCVCVCWGGRRGEERRKKKSPYDADLTSHCCWRWIEPRWCYYGRADGQDAMGSLWPRTRTHALGCKVHFAFWATPPNSVQSVCRPSGTERWRRNRQLHRP